MKSLRDYVLITVGVAIVWFALTRDVDRLTLLWVPGMALIMWGGFSRIADWLDMPVSIPADGKLHACRCGAGGYMVEDFDGYRRPEVWDDQMDRVAHACRRCDLELVVA